MGLYLKCVKCGLESELWGGAWPGLIIDATKKGWLIGFLDQTGKPLCPECNPFSIPPQPKGSDILGGSL